LVVIFILLSFCLVRHAQKKKEAYETEQECEVERGGGDKLPLLRKKTGRKWTKMKNKISKKDTGNNEVRSNIPDISEVDMEKRKHMDKKMVKDRKEKYLQTISENPEKKLNQKVKLLQTVGASIPDPVSLHSSSGKKEENLRDQALLCILKKSEMKLNMERQRRNSFLEQERHRRNSLGIVDVITESAAISEKIIGQGVDEEVDREADHSKQRRRESMHLYGSTASLGSGVSNVHDDENGEKRGEINFGLEYQHKQQVLVVRVIQGKDLAACDSNGLIDPYCLLTIQPDNKRQHTSVKKKTINPVWNQSVVFDGVSVEKLHTSVLSLHVFDYDRFSMDDSIGETQLALCEVDLTCKPVFWRALYHPVKDKLGELLVSLTYSPANNTLTLGILQARNLAAMDITGKSDPYVKVWLMFGSKKVVKKKTPVHKCTLNPTFNQTFEFGVSRDEVRNCSIDISVIDFDTIGRNEIIGKLVIGAGCSGAGERKHWADMMDKPRYPVMVWHRLRPEH